MAISDDALEDIRSGNDIVDVVSQYVRLNRKGSDFFGLCPFHRESSPSFSVSPQKQLFYCFGCGAAGNVMGFIMRIENLEFLDAVRLLANRIRYEIKETGGDFNSDKAQTRKRILEINEKAAEFYYQTLKNGGEEAVAYLKQRCITPQTAKKFRLGYTGAGRNNLYNAFSNDYDNDILIKSGLVVKGKNGEPYDRFFNRLMFPIQGLTGETVGFGGRVIGPGEPKYLNSPDTVAFEKSKNLYGLFFAKKARTDRLIIVEGYMDAISLQQGGVLNVAASLGTAFNQEHARTIKRAGFKSALVLFDSDKAGENAALKAIPVLLQAGVGVRVLQVSGGKDPDEYIKTHGIDDFLRMVENDSKSHVMFRVNVLAKQFDVSKTDEKVQFLKECSRILATLESQMEREAYADDIAAKYGVSKASIMSETVKSNVIPEVAKIAYKRKQAEISGSKGEDEARRGILNAICKDFETYNIIRRNISASELVVTAYVNFFQTCGELYNKRGSVHSGEILSYFKTTEEQRLVTNIFSDTFEYESKSDFKRAVTQMLFITKMAYYEQLLAKEKDFDKVMDISAKMRALNKEINVEDLA